jgi:hypothetical protein
MASETSIFFAISLRLRQASRRSWRIGQRQAVRVFHLHYVETIQSSFTICHPKIIETGLDLLSHPSLIFYESGYSLHTLTWTSS